MSVSMAVGAGLGKREKKREREKRGRWCRDGDDVFRKKSGSARFSTVYFWRCLGAMRGCGVAGGLVEGFSALVL